MSGGRSWTTGEQRKLHEMRSRRCKAAQIAYELGRTEAAIYSFLRYVPATPKTPPGLKPLDRLPPKVIRADTDWTPEELARLRELVDDGTTLRDSAKAVGRSYYAVRTAAANIGIVFMGRGNNSITRLDQEYNHFKKNAVEGSAKLLDALLAMAA